MKQFNLETTITTWRHNLQHNQAFLTEDLDELENHLRDHVEVLIQEGLAPKEAFTKALDRMGNGNEIATEYKKIRYTKSKRKSSALKMASWQITMFKNYLKIATRNFQRHKGFASINLFGLAVALAGCLLIGHYIQDELSYDQFHHKSDQIYRMGYGVIGWPYGRIIESEYPEVEQVVYLHTWPAYSIKHAEQRLFEKMIYAEEGFFQLFDFPLVEGNPETALADPYSVVLTQPLAKKLFGDESAMGQTITLEDSLQFTVSGITEVPKQSHIQFDFLLPFKTIRAQDQEWFDQEMASGWLDMHVVNYVELKPGTNVDVFAEKIRNLPMERAGDYLSSWGSNLELHLEPLNQLYLNSENDNPLGPQSNINNIYLLGTVGLFLLLIAIINFVNLSTARSVERAREVGVRKVVGSDRVTLIKQFLVESTLTCTVAVFLALLLAWLALPAFNDLALKQYTISDFITLKVATALIATVLIVGFLAGFYPALSLSSFLPATVLKGHFKTSVKGTRLRRGLVVFQFTLSGVLILGTLIVLNQLRFMQQQELGFDSEQVVVLDARQLPFYSLSDRANTFKQALVSHPALEEASFTLATPGRTGWPSQLSFPEGWPDGESMSLEYIGVDHHFMDVFGLEMVAGRAFDPTFARDSTTSVIINEAAVKAVGWPSPEAAIGKKFTSPGSGKPDGVVIGVVKDYHHHGLQQQIKPIMFGVLSISGFYALRFNSSEAGDVIEHLEKTWAQFFEGYPFDYVFLDEDFAHQYAQEQRLMGIFSTFALLTIVIACLGLFGLTAYATRQRKKEIGVRKLLGASVSQIALLLCSDFMKWILMSFLLAIPITYYVMTRWLEDFAYRTSIGVDTFLVGGTLLFAFALLTVSVQVFRTAYSQPVNSLRSE